MRIARFEGFGDHAEAALHARQRRLSSFGELTSAQLSTADKALAAAERGRSSWEFWKPSIEELRTMRGWLSDPRVGLATFHTYLQKARDAAGTAEWDRFLATEAATVNAASTAYQTATERPDYIRDPINTLASAGKWITIGLVAYAAIQAFALVPRRK